MSIVFKKYRNTFTGEKVEAAKEDSYDRGVLYWVHDSKGLKEVMTRIEFFCKYMRI